MRINITATSGEISKYLEKLSFYNFNEINEYEGTVDINSLDELFDLKLRLDCDIIIGQDYEKEILYLEIYNDYRE